MAAHYNGAMQAFQAQKWAEAASGLEKMLALAAANPALAAQLGPAYFTLGAAYFNTPNYPKAIETFQLFLKRYPTHERAIDVRLGLAQALTGNQAYGEALKVYEQLEAVGGLRDRALIAQAAIYKTQKKNEEALKILEKLSGAEIKTSLQARGAVQLAEHFADADEPERAIDVLRKLATKTELIESLVPLNTVAYKLGDEFLQKQKYPEALAAYRSVHPRERVLRFQTERIAMLERRMVENLKAGTGNPQVMTLAQMQNNELKAMIAESKALLTEFEKLEDSASGLLLRQARCWMDWGKKWEAIVVYDQIVRKHPQAKEREPALYGMVATYADLNQAQSAQRVCDLYLKEFPEGANAGTVGYLKGAVCLQAGDPKGAETFFGIMLEQQPKSEFRDQMQFLLGNAKFAQGKWAEAMAEYDKYLTTFPKGENVEEVEYRRAVTNVFAGKYEEALKALNIYLGKYDKGLFRPDAKYRIAVCYYAATEFAEVIKQCQAWLAEYPNDDLRGEVHSLLGDALAATNQPEEAIAAYISSRKTATADEVINYSLFEAGKLQQKLGQWAEMSAMFEEFVTEKPDHPAAIASLYWIGKAKARLGHEDEAKAFLVEQLKKYLNEPKREAVEQIISQLAQLCAKPSRRLAKESPPAASATAGSIPAPAAPPAAAQIEAAEPPAPAYDAVAELAKQLAPLAEVANKTGQARLLYARAELATFRKNARDREEAFAALANDFAVEELSPVLLGYVGDYLLGKGTPKNRAEAAARYTRLKEDFLKSDHLDFAYVGLGEIAYQESQYEKALEFFTDAIEKVGASLKLKEAMVGRAKTLLELGQYDESRKLFEQVASIREWRGDTTAMAVFSLGEIERRKGRLPEAIAHYRRVFVAYQKYVDWVARSYLRCAEAFEKMGKRQDAIENLREMLRNEKLQKLPEMDQARQRLAEWGAAA